MAVMLKAAKRHTCQYGRKCCDYDYAKARVLRRRERAREKRAWQREEK